MVIIAFKGRQNSKPDGKRVGEVVPELVVGFVLPKEPKGGSNNSADSNRDRTTPIIPFP